MPDTNDDLVTLIILPPHWRAVAKLQQSRNTRFATWDTPLDSLKGFRFDQVVGYPPPASASELRLWEGLSKLLTPTGKMVYL